MFIHFHRTAIQFKFFVLNTLSAHKINEFISPFECDESGEYYDSLTTDSFISFRVQYLLQCILKHAHHIFRKKDSKGANRIMKNKGQPGCLAKLH